MQNIEVFHGTKVQIFSLHYCKEIFHYFLSYFKFFRSRTYIQVPTCMHVFFFLMLSSPNTLFSPKCKKKKGKKWKLFCYGRRENKKIKKRGEHFYKSFHHNYHQYFACFCSPHQRIWKFFGVSYQGDHEKKSLLCLHILTDRSFFSGFN